MKFQEKLQEAEEAMDDAAKEGTRMLTLALEHDARKVPSDKGKADRTFYEVNIWLEGPPELVKDVKAVEYELHPTFSPRTVRRNSPPKFSLRLKIWGAFTVKARVFFADGATLDLFRFLSLTR
jgi:transcription initiation factor IIF auxiliary subunit